jgi:hypothetical protein
VPHTISARLKLATAGGCALFLLGACASADLFYGADGRIEFSRVWQLMLLVGGTWAFLTAVLVYFFHAKLLALLARDPQKFGTLVIDSLCRVIPDFREFLSKDVYPDRIKITDEAVTIAHMNRSKLDALGTDMTTIGTAIREFSGAVPAIVELKASITDLTDLMRAMSKEHTANMLEIARQGERLSSTERELDRWNGIEHRREQREPPDHQYKRAGDRGGRR